MVIDKTGPWWRGTDFTDLAELVKDSRAGGYPVADVQESFCAGCGGASFRVAVDDTEGCARHTCVSCGDSGFVHDSAEFWDEADPGPCAC
ncbi:MAG: hypothetical protein HOY71_49020, partial [Nonomuraea sp.]|nr:hypothetical protein [Nonomuraea sp.]